VDRLDRDCFRFPLRYQASGEAGGHKYRIRHGSIHWFGYRRTSWDYGIVSESLRRIADDLREYSDAEVALRCEMPVELVAEARKHYWEKRIDTKPFCGTGFKMIAPDDPVHFASAPIYRKRYGGFKRGSERAPRYEDSPWWHTSSIDWTDWSRAETSEIGAILAEDMGVAPQVAALYVDEICDDPRLEVETAEHPRVGGSFSPLQRKKLRWRLRVEKIKKEGPKQ